MKYALCLLAVLAIGVIAGGHVRAQTTEDSVKAAIHTLFVAMKDGDSAASFRAFTDSAIMQSESPGGAYKTFSPLSFAHRIASIGPGAADERIHIDLLRVDGSLAMVWAPYSFFLKGKFHHCGVDSFQLIRTAQGWKIQYIIYTVRTSGCPMGTPDAP